MTSVPEHSTPDLFKVSEQITVSRTPITASMTDGAILRGFCYERQETETGRRKKFQRSPAPLLCLADELGNAGEHHQFTLKLAALPESPQRIYTISLRGRGASDSVGLSDTSMASDADDLISFCDAHGLHDIDVLVSGRGSLAVLLTAPKRPSLIRKLVLNDGGVEFDAIGIARQTARQQRVLTPSSWSEAINQLKETRQEHFPLFEETDWEDLAKTIWRDDNGKPVQNFARGLVRLSNAVDYDSKQPDLGPELKILKTRPVMLIRGENSPFVTADIAQKLQVEHGNVSETVAIGQGHVPVLHKSELAQQILDFLTAQ